MKSGWIIKGRVKGDGRRIFMWVDSYPIKAWRTKRHGLRLAALSPSEQFATLDTSWTHVGYVDETEFRS